MPTYLSILGREPELSKAEFIAVLEENNISFSNVRQQKNSLVIETKKEILCRDIMKQLGGTLLISRKQPVAPEPQAIADLLESIVSVGKITFSLHCKKHATKIALSTKKELKSRGRSVRYVAPKNTATIIHNNLAHGRGDLHIFEGQVYLTEAVQDIEGFSHRDYDRPRVDSKSGMLPPKLSRMMINLAGGTNISSLHDPFCGSGTVLMEALTLGIPHISGSDLSAKAVEDSNTNISWLADKLEAKPHISIERHDASSISKLIPHGSIEAVVTEPYMGTPLRGKEPLAALQKQAAELSDLYTLALKEIHVILKEGGATVMIFPSFKWKNTWIHTVPEETVSNLFTIKKQPTNTFLRYHRSDQHLARDVWILRKK